MNYQKLIERFWAEDDAGNRYEVCHYQKMIVTRTRGGTIETPGMESLETSTGIHLNHVADDTFEFFDTGQRIRKVGA